MEIAVNMIIEKAAENQKHNIPFVMATVVEAIEGTPGRSGFKMLVYADGSSEGTIGGGMIEHKIIAGCRELFITKENRFLEFELAELGMICGGKAKLFLEYFPAQRTAYLFGAGHLCHSILPIIKSVGFRLVVIDSRPEYAAPARLPAADEVHAVDYVDYVHAMHPSPDDAIIIFTHGHSHDYEILLAVCRKHPDLKYIGMIASREKAKENLAQLRKENIPENLISSIHTPIGLNIAKTTTQEIAISIVAELLAEYNGVPEIKSLSKK
ncbi:MAG: XdhC/CoxI family protein [Candidatus Cloacimonetes bacterium]|nr:XdhC/CoxI family protein [Candidatus Cloacimonadota bacterium]